MKPQQKPGYYQQILHAWRTCTLVGTFQLQAIVSSVIIVLTFFEGNTLAQEIQSARTLYMHSAGVSVWPRMLDFGPFTGHPGEQAKNIPLEHPGAVVFTITAPETYEITVTADLPRYFVHERMPEVLLPVQLQLAYSNNREKTESEARGCSRIVPSGVSAFSFPVCRESGGIMLTPAVNGVHPSETITGKCHLFIFGTAGPATSGRETTAGNYKANIHVMITASPPDG